MAPHAVLVTAGGGHIGANLVPRLLKDQIKVVLPTSSASGLHKKLPADANPQLVAIEEGSIKDPQWLEAITKKHKVDAVFLCLTGTDELMVTLNAFDAFQRAGTVKHIVYVSGQGDYVSEEGLHNLVKHCSAMHVLVKPIVELKLLKTDYPWKTTVLGCTLFYSNDLRSKQSMLEDGIFDEPLGEAGVSRVSLDDIALAGHNALLNPTKWGGKKISLGSRHLYKASEIEKLWSDAIGKPVRMLKGDAAGLDQFEAHFLKKTGGTANYSPDRMSWARDIALMYQVFANAGFGAMSDEDYTMQVELLGRKESDYEEFIRTTGKSWRS